MKTRTTLYLDPCEKAPLRATVRYFGNASSLTVGPNDELTITAASPDALRAFLKAGQDALDAEMADVALEVAVRR